MTRDRNLAKKLAKEYIDKNQPLSWFDKLYQEGEDDFSKIPWADLAPNSNLISWIDNSDLDFEDCNCLVIGCGLGDDSEYLSKLGLKVDSFDVSETAIEICKKRFKYSKVNYFVHDITQIDIQEKYDFIFEAYTLQVLPLSLRNKAVGILPNLLIDNGHLLIICRGRDETEPIGDMPWPLTVNDLKYLDANLECIHFEDYLDKKENPVARRFRVHYKK